MMNTYSIIVKLIRKILCCVGIHKYRKVILLGKHLESGMIFYDCTRCKHIRYKLVNNV